MTTSILPASIPLVLSIQTNSAKEKHQICIKIFYKAMYCMGIAACTNQLHRTIIGRNCVHFLSFAYIQGALEHPTNLILCRLLQNKGKAKNPFKVTTNHKSNLSAKTAALAVIFFCHTLIACTIINTMHDNPLMKNLRDYVFLQSGYYIITITMQRIFNTFYPSSRSDLV